MSGYYVYIIETTCSKLIVNIYKGISQLSSLQLKGNEAF